MLEPIKVSLESLNLITLAPMLIAIAGGLIILSIDLLKEGLHKSLYVMLTVLILVVDLLSTVGLNINERGFFDVMLIDGISIVSQLLVIVGSIVFIPLALSSKRFHEYSYPEFFALFLFMVAGFQFMVASDNLILIFVGLETASLSLYTLIALHNRSNSYEAAVKYFTMGALAAGFFAMGSAMIYALTGSVELYKVAEVLATRTGEADLMIAIFGGFVLILVALGFKLSLYPFHTWAPDVYEGASAALVGYMSVVPKVAAFVVAIRIFGMYIDLGVEWVRIMILVIAVLTMTLANIMALVQEDVKRMLAYSSISHAGFVMAALALDTTEGNTSIFLYYALFMFTNLGAFAMLWISRHKMRRFNNRYDHPYEKFAGFIKIMPIGAVIMGLFMLSLAGVPPFSVFWGKIYVMQAAVNAGYIWLAVVMGLNSAIAAYYYLKLVVYMFLKDPVKDVDTIYYNISRPLMVIIGFATVATVGAIFYVQPLVSYIYYMISASGY
ncbi:NADH-quinone oxidoreductase subunit NuoN [Sulfurovum sp.]|jgi:NADH-quinone oxidoreductase subunit N|uniref:NADH-quinone oxidoreductase subunit NuoN n=1 Tax=Sulfurovum sp. TaxID=1969726 RepID=UPI002A3620ED|nr:NADH-quinone oxidoreductase subunit NuoN [Sulfurovum sp.]MDD2450546.1 NADH-quinone oxidoreductase subunit NuoN [Sulfurovum sp.]MDD3499361.1 NADH-quinone oxidoreductase subunit NuoN [Sulfurovum sp.]MDY0403800.1 NADH-quinone oxidoreductase subunit NuoN [Sulfurovum sp.]